MLVGQTNRQTDRHDSPIATNFYMQDYNKKINVNYMCNKWNK